MARSATIPTVWEPWLQALQILPPPAEPRANCAACVMCSDDDWTARRPDLRFRPDSRCCTYLPGLWCFQVGGVLTDDDTPPEVLEGLVARIHSPLSHPLGIAPTMPDDTRYQELVENQEFGRSTDLRCPHFQPEQGTCGVWRHRNAVCSTWHCRYERGMSGLGYWTAVRRVLEVLEVVLANRAASALLAGENVMDWSTWTGSRESFFKLSYQWVRGLDVSALLDDMPEEVWAAARTARAAGVQLRNLALPDVVELNEADALEEFNGMVRISGYSSYDTALVPMRLYKMLEQFDGRPVAEVRADLASVGVDLTDALLRRLIDIDVLR